MFIQKYGQIICLIGLLIALLGCEMQTGYRPSDYQPVQPRPEPAERQPSRLEFQPGVCTDRCREIIAAANLPSTRKREKALERIATRPNLTTHEQIHLIDVAEEKLGALARADVFIRLAKNPTLTVEARRYLKLKTDSLRSKDKRELLRELKKNPGVQSPRPGSPRPTPSQPEKVGKSPEGKTWRSNRWGFEVILQEDWEMKIFDKAEGIKVAKFWDKDNKIIYGIIAIEKSKVDCDTYITAVINSYDTAKLLTKPSGKTDASATYTAVVESGVKFQYYIRVIDISGTKLRFVAWSHVSNYPKYEATFKKYAKTLKGLKTSPAKPEGKTWRSNRWGFEVILQEDWEMKILDKPEGIKVARFWAKDNKIISGTIVIEKTKIDCDAYITAVLNNMKKSFETEVLKKPVGKSEATAIYTAVVKNIKFQYYIRVIDISGTKLRFTAWAYVGNYPKYEASFKKYAKTLKGKPSEEKEKKEKGKPKGKRKTKDKSKDKDLKKKGAKKKDHDSESSGPTPPPAPTAPAQVTSPNPTNDANDVPITTTQLSWAAASGATSYDVYFGTTNPPPSVGNTTAITHTVSLTCNTTYYWRIDAKNSAGTTTGIVWSFTTISNQSPTVTITDGPSGTTTDNTPTFTWSGSDSDGTVEGYYYSIDDSTPDNWTTVISYTSSTLANGSHTFYVQAKDNDGATSDVKSRSFTVRTGGKPSPNVIKFYYTGKPQTWVVPAGVTSIQVDVRGARGGGGPSGLGAMVGGKGARVQTTLKVTPTETLYIYAGCVGVPGGSWNGGADAGGGASDIRQGGTALSNRIVVAGGGGGASAAGGNGGDGGHNGANGTTITGGGGGGLGGGGGTQSAGGAGGTGSLGSGKDGALGVGGTGVVNPVIGAIKYLGGGGGGYYGGGGGGLDRDAGGGGGGGGSSYSAGTDTKYTDGYQSGAIYPHGQIIITW